MGRAALDRLGDAKHFVRALHADVCWMRPGDDARLWAVIPDFGVFDSVASLDSGVAFVFCGRQARLQESLH